MPVPLALCIEDRSAADRAPRLLRCVALVGRQPGLGLDAAGEACWQLGGPLACELWVSADDRLIAFRPVGAGPVALARAGRSLELPVARPVVVLDRDELVLGSRRLRLHLHGRAPAVAAPAPLGARGTPGAARLAAALALGAAVSSCDRPIEVRETPPEVRVEPEDRPPPADPTTRASGESSPAGSGAQPGPFATPPPTGAAASSPEPESPPPIEVRESPPDMAPAKD